MSCKRIFAICLPFLSARFVGRKRTIEVSRPRDSTRFVCRKRERRNSPFGQQKENCHATLSAADSGLGSVVAEVHRALVPQAARAFQNAAAVATLSADLSNRIFNHCYESGHIVYRDEMARVKLSRDLAIFIQQALASQTTAPSTSTVDAP